MEIPDYIDDYVRQARRIFGLYEDWHIHVKMVEKPGSKSNWDGCCQPDAIYLNATMEFIDGIEQGDLARSNVFHEVLHVAHAEIDEVVYQMEKLIPYKERKILREDYMKAVERFAQRTSRSMTSCLGMPTSSADADPSADKNRRRKK